MGSNGERVDDWREKANCRGMDPILFFSGLTWRGHVTREKVTPEVRRICGECEVGKQCEVDALRNGDIGIRNGKTTNEREAQERLKEQQIRRVTGGT